MYGMLGRGVGVEARVWVGVGTGVGVGLGGGGEGSGEGDWWGGAGWLGMVGGGEGLGGMRGGHPHSAGYGDKSVGETCEKGTNRTPYRKHSKIQQNIFNTQTNKLKHDRISFRFSTCETKKQLTSNPTTPTYTTCRPRI